ncbi:MAG: hypothetical protein ABIK09_02640 [Pseudomonadota bacterium]
MQQAAALEDLVLEAQAQGWDDLTAVFLNQAQDVTTFDYLSTEFGGPAVQDPDDGSLWAAFGLGYNGAMIVDRDGVMTALFSTPSFPDDAEAISAALQEALEQP